MPLVKGPRAVSRWFARICAYCGGLLLTAALTGGIIGLIGNSLAALGLTRNSLVFPFGIAIVALLYGSAEFVPLHLPQPIDRAWQVPATWGRFGRTGMALLFGATVGTGFLTRIGFMGYYILVGLMVASSSVSVSVAAFIAYGLGRLLPFVTAAILQLRGMEPTNFVISVTGKTVLWTMVRGACLLLLGLSLMLQVASSL